MFGFYLTEFFELDLAGAVLVDLLQQVFQLDQTVLQFLEEAVEAQKDHLARSQADVIAAWGLCQKILEPQ